MMRIDRIRRNLTEALSPQHVEVIDESEQHRGHSGYQDGGESHFHVTIRVEGFAELSRVKRHRAIYEAIGAELMAEIHALSLDISA